MLIADDGHPWPGFAPDWLKSEVEAPDCTDGTHPRLRYLAKWLTIYFDGHEGEASRWLHHAADRCDRTTDEGEISRLLAWAESSFGSDETDTAKPAPSAGKVDSNPRSASHDLEEIFSIAEAGPRLAGFRESSPVHLSTEPERDTERVLQAWADYAWQDDPWVCFGSDDRFWTRRLSDCGYILALHPLIVPSPMSSQYGETKTGHLSEHSLEAVGERMFLVCEFDFTRRTPKGKPTPWVYLLDQCEAVGITVLDINAALIAHLAKQRALWMTVFSGNKSLQAWFPCRGEPETSLRQWFNLNARRLGACSSTWSKSQFVRMPDGTRSVDKDGRQPRQTIEFFNPAVL